MDRIAHSVWELNALLNMAFKTCSRSGSPPGPPGLSIEFAKEGVVFDSNSADPTASLQCELLSKLAAFERDAVRERQGGGLMASGGSEKSGGRPRRLPKAAVREVRKAVESGVPKVAVARRFGISRATLYRYLS